MGRQPDAAVSVDAGRVRQEDQRLPLSDPVPPISVRSDASLHGEQTPRHRGYRTGEPTLVRPDRAEPMPPAAAFRLSPLRLAARSYERVSYEAWDRDGPRVRYLSLRRSTTPSALGEECESRVDRRGIRVVASCDGRIVITATNAPMSYRLLMRATVSRHWPSSHTATWSKEPKVLQAAVTRIQAVSSQTFERLEPSVP
jgi:hypothetical protein